MIQVQITQQKKKPVLPITRDETQATGHSWSCLAAQTKETPSREARRDSESSRRKGTPVRAIVR